MWWYCCVQSRVRRQPAAQGRRKCALHDKLPDSAAFVLKPVMRVLSSLKGFQEEMLETARWISEYYLCNISDALRLFMVFMGTPDFAVPSLKKLYDAGYDIAAVVTQTDKERGRGKKVSFSPVKECAIELGIPVLQPKTLKDEEIQGEIKRLKPDVIIVIAYGKILPKALLDAAPYGCLNVHGSLLPAYRGAAPIQHEPTAQKRPPGIAG